MATFELNAEVRNSKGTSLARRLRRTGKVPGILYGGDQDPVSITLEHDQIMHSLDNEAFHTSILTVKAGAETQKAILRDVQMHPFRPRVMHVDLQRVSATEKIHMKVPIHFAGEDSAPGVKTQGGVMSHVINEVDVSCLPADLPEFLEADASGLNLGDALHLSDLKLPDGVELTLLTHGGEDVAIAAVTMVKTVVEEEEVEGEEGELAEGEAAAASTEAADEEESSEG
ncbi:MAG: 50S ribosomal protein L25/general stress protein Ctc [Gammaproteobacteria bacterium]|nr:50S ribosomal protein L25/general stress protein Ctc [Gammaproteobacteria bacterium]